ncbi:polysaccharide lyase 8 family protein [Nonomuraea sediminis]|uniref:polysaccharide lyase 8 family protein n=1 Tax=Nonomuraea sediminis TaxID=2835864 RepID=UPI0027DEEE44|nr:polysaccharide lyase 8 family protein [Nonomuraea sediminis]
MTGLTRRDFLQLGAVSVLPAVPSDDFGTMRSRWREISLAGGPGSGVVAMARQYARTGDAALGRAVAAEIDRYRREVYHAGAEPAGNWWTWQIGTPKRLLDAAVLIGPYLGDGRPLAEAVDHFVPECVLADYSGTSTAANRVDLCLVTLLRSMLTGDAGKAALAVSALSPVFRYVSEGDGIYRDGSFIQHSTVPYQGEYGVVLLSGLAAMFKLVRGTPWEVTDPARHNVHDTVERGFAPFVHAGACMDLVRGRAISRAPSGDRRSAARLAAAVWLLGETAPPADRRRWQAMVRRWESGAPEPPGHRLLPMSARAVHRAGGWCAALSMSSYRIAHYEHGNGENLRGWHTGAGMLYWWAEGHADQYSGTFWSTVDPYRLPGTTVSTKRLPDGAGQAWGGACPPGRWVGGATDGVHATVGQHLNGLESTLEAFKSWIFLQDAVVCLGAGITCDDGVPVETVVDNRRATTPLTVRPAWAYLAGHGGYVVIDGRLRTLRERGYTTLWLDHGLDPSSASYVYLLMPGATRAATEARAADPSWARVIANTAYQQGIQVPGLIAVNFWTAGTAGPLSASGPCAVLVREHGATATITVSDPCRDLDGLTVTWDRPVSQVLRAHPRLTSATTGQRLTLTFGRLSDRGGASHPVTVALTPETGSG